MNARRPERERGSVAPKVVGAIWIAFTIVAFAGLALFLIASCQMQRTGDVLTRSFFEGAGRSLDQAARDGVATTSAPSAATSTAALSPPPGPAVTIPGSACTVESAPADAVGTPVLTTAENGEQAVRVEFSNPSTTAMHYEADLLVFPPEGGKSETVVARALVPAGSTATATAAVAPETSPASTVIVLRSCSWLAE